MIALEPLTYPPEALKRKAAGDVTLTAVITRAGRVNRVSIVNAESIADGEKNFLADAAARNLSSWQLEPGSHRESIQIVYSYVIDSSLANRSGIQVRWALPNRVMIRGKP